MDDIVERLLAGAHPITIRREHRGPSVSALAEKAGVPRSCLAEIESLGKPGSVQAFRGAAPALGVPMNDLPFDEAMRTPEGPTDGTSRTSHDGA